jgi:hypothetical protein
MCRCYKEREHTLEPLRPKLDDKKKEQLKALLAEQSLKRDTQSNAHDMGRQTEP